MKSIAMYMVVVVVVLVGMVHSDSVHRFEIESEEKQLFDFLMRPKSFKPTRLGKYSYKDCGDPSKELVIFKNLTFGPDPISFPGELDVSFDGTIKTTLDAPLKAVLKISKRVGSKYIKIPCIGVIGSCTYDDICSMLAGATCPPPFVTNKIPCKCPFPAGTYNLPKATF